MGEPTRSFHIADYCVFAAFLALSLAIGLYHAFTGGRQRTKGEYLMGNRQMSLLPVAISILVSVISSNTIVGLPADVYSYGIDYFPIILGAGVGLAGVAVTFVPLIYPLKITSCYEYLELRFNSPLPKKLCSFLLIIKQIFYIGTVLYGPATALEAVTGLPAASSILTVTVVGTVYTSLGGMKAVIYTDTFQSTIMLGGLMAVVIKGSYQIGGIKKVFEISSQDGRANLQKLLVFNPSQRVDIYSMTIGMVIFWMGEYGINQPTAQRYCSLTTLTKARVSMLLNIPGYLIIVGLAMLAGYVSYAYFAQSGCDPLYTGEITNSNQVLALFTMEVLGYPGVPGLMLACIFSGSLSTVSSSLNSMAACLWEDFLIHNFKHYSELRVTILMKIIVVLFGIITMGMAFLVKFIGGTVAQLSGSFTGMALGPMLGMYFLGACFRFTEAWGAFCGGIAGFFLPCWIMFGSVILKIKHPKLPGRIHGCPTSNSSLDMSYYNSSHMPWNGSFYHSSAAEFLPPMDTNITGLSDGWNKFYLISFCWYPTLGFLLTMLVGLIISTFIRIYRKKPYYVDNKYLFPFCRSSCDMKNRNEEPSPLEMEPINKSKC